MRVTGKGMTSMLQTYETALEMEVERRREVLADSMRAARGVAPATGRVAGTLRFRHFLAVVTTIVR
jgi:hypothetical protein